MKRSSRKEIATQTVEIIERGSYRSTGGQSVDIAQLVRDCLARTQYFSVEDMKQIQERARSIAATDHPASIELVNETSLAGIARLVQQGPVAALNFASAKNPGGGFLNGSQAQEESLARSSALYASQLTASTFYDRHRAMSSLLYTDAMILSPDCPIIRDDEGNLLDAPHLASFITCAAPNAGATADNHPEELPLIPETLRQRCECVLALAAEKSCRQLILGAWGCGVFRNDPAIVAEAFMSHLRKKEWSHRFERVLFSVLDTSPTQETFKAFKQAIHR